MQKMTSLVEVEKNKFTAILKNPISNYENKFTYQYNFEIKYELLAPILKDMQMVSQIIKCVKNHQLSDLIMIYGPNSYSKDSRFYFNYRHIIDFYVKVNDFIETNYYTKILYNIYKTGPISKNFIVILSLYKNDENENSSKLELEIILSKDSIISQKIINIIYTELNYNYLYLSQAIKNKKHNSCFYNSSIIKNEFHILCQIMQNVKLIQYIINGALKKISGSEKKEEFNDNDKFIHFNDIYKINLNKKKEFNEWIFSNKTRLKINFLNTKEDRMIIQYKIFSNEHEINKDDGNQIYNIILVHVRKLTNNNCFVLIKTSLENNFPENILKELQKLMKKSLNKIDKLCQISKDKYNF